MVPAAFTQRLLTLGLALLLAACAHTPSSRPPTAQAIGVDEHRRSAVVLSALSLLDTPYRYGGREPSTGFDCSGLIGFVYRDAAGISLPRSTRELIVMQAPNVGKEGLQTGDLIFFATNGGSQVSHAGIYVGEGRFVHAPATGGTVKLDSLSKAYWQKAYLSAKRVLQPEHLAHNP